MNSLSKIFFSAGLIAYAGFSQAVSLFDETEAERLRLTDQEWQALDKKSATTRSFSFDSDGQKGPSIQFLFPEIKQQSEIETGSPTDLTILFQGNNAEVDMSSLDVEISKGWFSFSITDKLSPYIQGSRISAQEVEIPSGKYKVEILVKDMEGNETQATYRLSVR